MKLALQRHLPISAVVMASFCFAAPAVEAIPIAVANAGFEDTSGQAVFNEFTFGTPAGWNLHDPNSITSDPDVFTGTLFPNGTDFFNGVAPEGDRVALLFNRGQRDAGEYGYVQTLGDTLQANTRYTLNVAVGNIASGTAENNEFFDLSGFPGYRIDLLAGGVVIAQDLDTLSIAEGEFLVSELVFDTGDADAQLGQALGIRLVNLNETRGALTPFPDLEVDFDDVTLDATALAVSEPSSLALFGLGLVALAWRARRREYPIKLADDKPFASIWEQRHSAKMRRPLIYRP